MEVIKDKYNWVILTLIAALIVLMCFFNVGCTPKKYIYRVEFTNGDVEYYELDHKLKVDSKAIEYDGEVIIGINKIEKYE